MESVWEVLFALMPSTCRDAGCVARGALEVLPTHSVKGNFSSRLGTAQVTVAVSRPSASDVPEACAGPPPELGLAPGLGSLPCPHMAPLAHLATPEPLSLHHVSWYAG